MDIFESFGMLISFGFSLLLFVVAYFVGSWLEKRHFRDIQKRESAARGFPVVSFESVPNGGKINSSELVSGNIVVSLDYFKRIVAALRSFIGGRVKTYEPLLDRARREAILRMVETAQSQGYDAVVNVRLETSRLANARAGGKSTAGVEMLAFGTAVKFASRLASAGR